MRHSHSLGIMLVLFACAHDAADSTGAGPKGDGFLGAPETGYPSAGYVVASYGKGEPWSNAYCTATLIAPRVALTASHCLLDSAFGGTGAPIAPHFGIGFGGVGSGQVFDASFAVTHPDFEIGTVSFRHDVAVLVLERSVEGITPAEIAAPTIDSPGAPDLAGKVGDLGVVHTFGDGTATQDGDTLVLAGTSGGGGVKIDGARVAGKYVRFAASFVGDRSVPSLAGAVAVGSDHGALWNGLPWDGLPMPDGAFVGRIPDDAAWMSISLLGRGTPTSLRLSDLIVEDPSRCVATYREVGYGGEGEALGARHSFAACVDGFDDLSVWARGKDGGSCVGDSGGPLFEEGSGRLVGVLRGAGVDGATCETHDHSLYSSVVGERAFIERFLGTDPEATIPTQARVVGTDGDGLLVRSGPSPTQPAAGLLAEGSSVEVLNPQSHDWIQVKQGALAGWAKVHYLQMLP